MPTPNTLATARARRLIDRARELAAADTADQIRDFYRHSGRADLATETWPALQTAALATARALLDEAAALLDEATAPAPARTAPVEVIDDNLDMVRGELYQSPLSPDWSVRLTLDAGRINPARAVLPDGTASTLADALAALAAEAHRRNFAARYIT